MQASAASSWKAADSRAGTVQRRICGPTQYPPVLDGIYVVTQARIWAPWRMQYLRAPETGSGQCPLCAYAASEPSRISRVLARWPHCVLVLNKYPYTSGHLMVVVRRHRGDIAELEASEADQLWRMAHQAGLRLRRATHAQGLNIGVNLGRAAGAGIEEHLHVHVVPRWDGDCNFMPVLAETRVIPEYLEETWDFLWPHFADLDSGTEPLP